MAALPSPATFRDPHQAPRPGAPTAERPALRIVGQPRHHLRYLAVLLLLTSFGVFGVVSIHAFAAEAAFQARALEHEVDTLGERVTELHAEIAMLRAPDRIREVATGELGMVVPQNPTYIVLEQPLRSPTRADEVGIASAARPY